MKRIAALVLSLCVFSLAAVAAANQSKSGAEQNTPEADVVSKSTTAIGYVVGGGSTGVKFKGTELMPGA